MIFPFRGLRYDINKVDIKDVVSQPYDIITPEMQDLYYKKSPYNIVRIILNREEDRYTSAGKYLMEWMRTGVFSVEEKPAIYLYEQLFSVQGAKFRRRSFIALLKLYEFGKGVVFPHEYTLSGPKEDRFKLTMSTNAHWGQIFMLYDDRNNDVGCVLSSAYEEPPEFSFIGDDGVTHTFWVVRDRNIHEKIASITENMKFVIADGHHRYETALRYKKYMDTLNGFRDDAPWNYRMVALVAFQDPGLQIFPIHRVIKGIAIPELTALNAHFAIVRVETLERLRKMLIGAVKSGKKGAIGVFGRGIGYYYLELRNIKDALSVGGNGHSDMWKELDVNILQNLVMEPLLGMSVEQIKNSGNIAYTESFIEANRMVESGEYEMCFFLNPVRKDQVRDISLNGELLPQKSTYFYPKMLTGLVEQYMGGNLSIGRDNGKSSGSGGLKCRY